MSWVKEAIAQLERGEIARVRPQGGSMRGRIESGQLVSIGPVDRAIAVGDVVFVRWKGNYLLQLVKEVGDQGLLIGNNVGKVNGWAPRTDVLGVVLSVDP